MKRRWRSGQRFLTGNEIPACRYAVGPRLTLSHGSADWVPAAEPAGYRRKNPAEAGSAGPILARFSGVLPPVATGLQPVAAPRSRYDTRSGPRRLASVTRAGRFGTVRPVFQCRSRGP